MENVAFQIESKPAPGLWILLGKRADQVAKHIGDHIFAAVRERCRDCRRGA